MKTKINIQEVKVNIVKIDYIKSGHEGVQLLIEYYNVLLTTSTHKIYTKNISVEPHKGFSLDSTPHLGVPPSNTQHRSRYSTTLVLLSFAKVIHFHKKTSLTFTSN